MMTVPISVVSPWYTPGMISGGSELHAFGLASAFKEAGFEAELLTSCGISNFDPWDRNVLPAGVDKTGPVTIRRFRLDAQNHDLYDALFAKLHSNQPLTYLEELQLSWQKVSSVAMYHYIATHAERMYFFLPAYYGLTYWGLKNATNGFLIPCLHDEPESYLRTTKEAFQNAAFTFFNTAEEYELAARVTQTKIRGVVVGEGVPNVPSAPPNAIHNTPGLPDRYLLYIGRKVAGKNLSTLITYFLNASLPDLFLVLVGPGSLSNLGYDVQDLRSKGVVDLGPVDELTKHSIIAGAIALCQLSNMESFSLVIMEAWQHRIPVIVDASCSVTSGHCRRSGGGIICADATDFSRAVEALANDAELRVRLGVDGYNYVQNNYTWPIVIERIRKVVGW